MGRQSNPINLLLILVWRFPWMGLDPFDRSFLLLEDFQIPWLEPLAQEERDEGSRRDGVLLGEGARAAERTPRARESLRPRTLSEPAPPCTRGSLLARQSQAPATASLWGDVTDTPIG